MNSLKLDSDTWDLVLDAAGNIATVSNAERIAQDVATVCRTNLGECIYDTTRGIRYSQDFLGQPPNTSLFKAAVVQAALTVPGVVSAVCYLTALTPQLQGQIQCTGSDGSVVTVAL